MARLRSAGVPSRELAILHELKSLDASMSMGEPTHTYGWKNNERRAELHGRPCVVIAAGKKRTVLIEFTDNGERVTTSARAIKRI